MKEGAPKDGKLSSKWNIVGDIFGLSCSALIVGVFILELRCTFKIEVRRNVKGSDSSLTWEHKRMTK